MGNSLNAPTSELLTAGGDTRLLCDEQGLNKYGCSPLPRADLVDFGSCTCSSISPSGFEAAQSLHRELAREARWENVAAVNAWIRRRLAELLQLPSEVDVVLAPSGTDAEYLALWLAASKSDRPLVNILIGPSEVGTGTKSAAAGRFYDTIAACGDEVTKGDAVNQTLADRVTVENVEVRTPSGEIRSSTEIDAEVADLATRALSSGSQVLLHVVAHSKTGIHAPGIDCAKRVKSLVGDDVTIVIDAAQGRINRRTLREWLELECLVIWTASKFFGAPPFVGTLFVPPSLQATNAKHKLPHEFSSFFTRYDFPARWKCREQLRDWTNYGALLRWAAAIREIEDFYQTPLDIRKQVLATFEELVPNIFASSKSLELQPSFDRFDETCSEFRVLESTTTVFSFCVKANDRLLDREALSELHQLANQVVVDNVEPKHEQMMARQFHLGQPVRLGESKWALRIALGGVLIGRLGWDRRLGNTLEARLEWLEEQITALRDKLDLLCTSSAVHRRNRERASSERASS